MRGFVLVGMGGRGGAGAEEGRGGGATEADIGVVDVQRLPGSGGVWQLRHGREEERGTGGDAVAVSERSGRPIGPGLGAHHRPK